MADQTQPGGGTGAEQDPWAPPEHKTSLEKGASAAAGPQDQQPAAQPHSVHDQATVTSFPPAPDQSAPGFGAPTYAPPGGGPAAPGGWADPAVPPPPIAPGGPGAAPGGYGYPAYPQGYGWPAMPPPPQNGMGTAAMVLGILSCCLFCLYGVVGLILGVLAVVFGVKGKRRADRGEATNRGQAQAGFITGIVGIILGLATIALLIVGIVVAIHDKNNIDQGPSYNSAPSVSAPLLVQD